MKLKIFLMVIATCVCFETYSQDTIVKTNGDTIICKIKGQDDNTVYFTVTRDGKETSSYFDKNEIKTIKSGSNEVVQLSKQPAVNNFDMTSLGFGIGMDYGGFGGNFLYYPATNFGIFAGFGYPLIGFGYNIGIKIRLVTEKHTSSVSTYLLGMYGYNAAISIENASNLNKLFYGPTIGFGLDYKARKSSSGYWSFGLYVPIRGQEVNNYIDDLKTNYGAEFKNELIPFSISVGYRIILN